MKTSVSQIINRMWFIYNVCNGHKLQLVCVRDSEKEKNKHMTSSLWYVELYLWKRFSCKTVEVHMGSAWYFRWKQQTYQSSEKSSSLSKLSFLARKWAGCSNTNCLHQHLSRGAIYRYSRSRETGERCRKGCQMFLWLKQREWEMWGGVRGSTLN